MTVVLNQKLIEALKRKRITTFLRPGASVARHSVFEPPCSFKWMRIEHSIALGAFSYAVSGYYFACRIGRYCSFGEDVQVGRHAHPTNWFSTSPCFYQEFSSVFDQPLPATVELEPRSDFLNRTPPVVLKITNIANDVYIGHGAFVFPGVTVATGAVIGARSVVTKDVPPYAIVAGAPARVVRYRFSDPDIERLMKSEWWKFAPWQLRGAPVDDIAGFLDFISSLRCSGVIDYAPDPVNLVALMVDGGPELSDNSDAAAS